MKNRVCCENEKEKEKKTRIIFWENSDCKVETPFLRIWATDERME